MVPNCAFDHYDHMVATAAILSSKNESVRGIYPYMLRSVCRPKTSTSLKIRLQNKNESYLKEYPNDRFSVHGMELDKRK